MLLAGILFGWFVWVLLEELVGILLLVILRGIFLGVFFLLVLKEEFFV